MFIYEIKSNKKSIITKIVISVNYLTLYTNKPSRQEFKTLTDELGFISDSFFAEHPEHVFCHTPFVEFSARGSFHPHRHFAFPKNANRKDMLAKLLEGMVELQNNTKKRIALREELIKGLDKERLSYGHKKFPENVQEAIDSYDTETDFIAANEISIIIKKFSEYEVNSFLITCEKIARCAQALLNDNFQEVYGNMISWEEPENDHFKLYQSLKTLWAYLHGISMYQGRVDLLFQALAIIADIKKNPLIANNKYQNVNNCVSSLKRDIVNKLQQSTCNDINKASLVGYCLMLFYLFYKCKSDNGCKNFTTGFIAMTLLNLIINFLFKPLAKCFSSYHAAGLLFKPENNTKYDISDIKISIKPHND